MLKLSVYFIFLVPFFLTANQKESVVCLHGFLGAPWNMRYIERNLKKDHWDATCWKYPSRDCFIEQHAEKLVSYLTELANQKPDQAIHFVTHSMGGLVLLATLNNPLCPKEAKIGKVIMLAPPAKGAYWGRWLGQFSIARRLAKKFSGYELMTQTQFDYLGKYPDSLKAVLVIAGSFGFNPFLKEKNDGTLAVSETVLSTPHKHIVINRGHKTIVFSKKTYGLIRQFLEEEN